MRVGGHQIKALLLSLSVLCTNATLAQAQDRWTALVLGNPTEGAERAFSDSFYTAEAFKMNADLDVTLHRELGPDQILAALDALSGQEQVVIYFSGALDQQTGTNILVAQDVADPRLALSEIINALAASGTKRLAVLLENCAGMSGANTALTETQAPDGLELLLAASTNIANACVEGATRLSDVLNPAMTNGDVFDLGDLLTESGLWVEASLGLNGFHFGAESVAQGGGDVLVLDLPATQAAAPVLELVVIAAPIETVNVTASTVITAAVAPTTISQVAASPGAGPAIFVPPPLSQQASVAVAAGLPEPSIIIGLLDVTNASFEVIPDDLGPLSGNEVSFDNLDARLAMRESDPELFATLVASGAFDPPTNQLAAALQIELKRMGCYTSRIDGDWGRGSRASVDRYFKEAGGTPETQEATHVLFRQIILNEDVTCPVPVAAAPVVRSTTTRSSGGTTTRTPAPAAAAPAPAAAPAINTSAIGVFR